MNAEQIPNDIATAKETQFFFSLSVGDDDTACLENNR